MVVVVVPAHEILAYPEAVMHPTTPYEDVVI